MFYQASQAVKLRTKKKKARMNQDIHIRDIFVFSDDPEFSWGEAKKHLNLYEEDILTRLVDHVASLAKIANIYHEKYYCEKDSDGTVEIKPDCKNKITRILLNEFSLYGHTPIDMNTFQLFVKEVIAIAENQHENVHLLISSIPVISDKDEILNMCLYVQCGKEPKIMPICKGRPSRFDVEYNYPNFSQRAEKRIIKCDSPVFSQQSWKSFECDLPEFFREEGSEQVVQCDLPDFSQEEDFDEAIDCDAYISHEEGSEQVVQCDLPDFSQEEDFDEAIDCDAYISHEEGSEQVVQCDLPDFSQEEDSEDDIESDFYFHQEENSDESHLITEYMPYPNEVSNFIVDYQPLPRAKKNPAIDKQKEKENEPDNAEINPIVDIKLAPKVTISNNAIFMVETVGGAKYSQAVEICLDHNIGHAMKLMQSIIDRDVSKETEFIPDQVDHILTSNTIEPEVGSMIAEDVVHIDSTATKRKYRHCNDDIVDESDLACVMNEKYDAMTIVRESSHGGFLISNPPFGSEYRLLARGERKLGGFAVNLKGKVSRHNRSITHNQQNILFNQEESQVHKKFSQGR